ncbi:hypothetical protein PM082_006254 [Marasmius tenuissimus]|nr:hypothetical protein PM082_006254 [Marasmius tenuissimus]
MPPLLHTGMAEVWDRMGPHGSIPPCISRFTDETGCRSLLIPTRSNTEQSKGRDKVFVPSSDPSASRLIFGKSNPMRISFLEPSNVLSKVQIVEVEA